MVKGNSGRTGAESVGDRIDEVDVRENVDMEADLGDLLLVRRRMDSISESLEGVLGMLASAVVAPCDILEEVAHVSPDDMLGREGA